MALEQFPKGSHSEGAIITITHDQGESDYRVIAIYEAGGRRYIALTPDLDTPELEADIRSEEAHV